MAEGMYAAVVLLFMTSPMYKMFDYGALTAVSVSTLLEKDETMNEQRSLRGVEGSGQLMRPVTVV